MLLQGTVVLDTSIILKWFRQGEVLADQALKLRDAYLIGQITVSVPWLATYELTNVLRYKADLNITQVQEAIQSLFDLGLEWVLPSNVNLRRTVEIARVYDITAYDAVFVVVAEMLSATFISADERLVQRLTGLPYISFLGEIREGS